jgi:LysB family phage lysis regulatory protein
MLATVKAWLWVAPYVIIALCVAAIFYYRYDGAQAHSALALTQVQLDGAIATNKQQQKTIDDQAEIAKAKDAIVSKLSDDIAAINQTVINSNAAFNNLYGSDPDAKAFAQRPIPDSVKRLHNRP